ncbi:MAG: BON domain-containing protein [Anaerolineales bacterium]|jgi:osmotically-inducible protein OsmY
MTELAHFIPDENLRAAILAKFAAESRIASTNVRVGVLNGIAHLAGEVDSLAKRSMAEDLAREIPGVRGIVNRIEAPGAPNPSRTVNLDLSPNPKDDSP